MGDELNRAFQYRQRVRVIREAAANQLHPLMRYQMFQIAEEYERLAIGAEALETVERCERRSATAVILPFGPRL